MAGKKGCSGGYRPGSGRPAGATAIKKAGKAKVKKKKVVEPEPSKASVTFLDAFVVKKRPQRLSPQPHRACGRRSNPGHADGCFRPASLS